MFSYSVARPQGLSLPLLTTDLLQSKVVTPVCGFSLRKYPVIQTDDDRERYKAVFQDQFSEYKELSAEVQAILRKFDELDAVMSRLPHHSENRQVGVHSCGEEE